MPRRSRTATARFTDEHYASLSATAKKKGISISELVRRMTVIPAEDGQGGFVDSPIGWLDGDGFAAELRVFEMRLDAIGTVVENKLATHDRLIEALAELTSALRARCKRGSRT